jgi:nitroreductase
MSATPDPQHALTQALAWRYATKLFDPDAKIDEADWSVLKDSLRWAPSSYGLQPWRFTVVQDIGLRAQLREAAWGQAQVTDCSHFVVLTSLKQLDAAFVERHVARTAEQRGIPMESLARFREVAASNLLNGPRFQTIGEWGRRQAYIAMGFVLLAAAELKVDACPIEGIDHAAFDHILGLEQGPWATVATVALGYRAAGDKYAAIPKVRFAEADVFDLR